MVYSDDEYWMRLFFKRLLLTSECDQSFFSWAAFLACMLAGATLRAFFPEAPGLPLLGAAAAAVLVGGAAYYWEFGRADRKGSAANDS